MDRSIVLKEEERLRRESHYQAVRDQLAKERDRILNRMLPGRYALHHEAQVFPLAVEIRFPATSVAPKSAHKAAIRSDERAAR